jgi:hypothetical protein
MLRNRDRGHGIAWSVFFEQLSVEEKTTCAPNWFGC